MKNFKFINIKGVGGVRGDFTKALVFSLLAFSLWTAGAFLWFSLPDQQVKVDLQNRRMNNLLQVIQRYKEFPDRKKKESIMEEPIVIVSSLVDKMGLKDNLVQISSLSKGISVQLTRLYFMKAISFLQEIPKRGLTIDSAELRYVPEGGDRLMSMTLIVTVAP